MLVDGDVEALSRDDSFSAQHILTPLQGVAVHINAFNFPCWGMLEKLAPTLLAGMPAIVKPASQTAYLTELMVRRIVETGLLPEGALQLICGSVGDLLDHVDRPGRGYLHRLRLDRPQAEDPSGDRRELGSLHHGGRQPERLRSWVPTPAPERRSSTSSSRRWRAR